MERALNLETSAASIYRRSFMSNGDFSMIADEPIVARELLSDNVTQNSFYNSLGTFYNNQHIKRYWFTSSNDLSFCGFANSCHKFDVHIKSDIF